MEENVTFEVDGFTFRPKRLTCHEFLALQTILNFSDFDGADKMFVIILESMEVKVGETWQPVKEKGAEVYLPVQLKDDLRMMYKLCVTFINKVVNPAFQKSTESK